MRSPDPRLIGLLEAYDRHVADTVLALREVILEEVPDANETVYEVSYTIAIWFGLTRKMKQNFCYISTHSTHANLGFPRGATMPDPSRVLEGTGRVMRHIKFKSLADVERSFVRRYIRTAVEHVAGAEMEEAAGAGTTVVKTRDVLAKRKRPLGTLFSKQNAKKRKRR